MTRTEFLTKTMDYKIALMEMDANYRSILNQKSTPKEIKDILKSMSLLVDIVNAGGFRESFTLPRGLYE